MDIFARRQMFRMDMEAVRDAFFLLNEGYVSLEKRSICTRKEFEKICSDIRDGIIPVADIDGGGVEHMALKMTATFLFPRNKLQFEIEFEGCRPDVLVRDGERFFLIECGETNPQKFFHYFKDRLVSQLILIPYPTTEQEWIEGYFLTPSADCADFLFFIEEERMKSLKKRMSKRT